MTQYQQLVQPNPNISCQPGWCLQYVRQTFGAPVVEPTATMGWNNARYRHQDYDFPAGCYVPVWFSLEREPAGHVALLCPDGSVYSTSDDSTVPHHHPSLDDLIAYYWRNPLTYLGWSEDISGVRVVSEATISYESVGDDMPTATEVAQAILDFKVDAVTGGQINLGAFLAEARDNNNKIVENTSAWILPQVLTLREVVNSLAVKQGVTIDYDEIARKVADEMSRRLNKT